MVNKRGVLVLGSGKGKGGTMAAVGALLLATAGAVWYFGKSSGGGGSVNPKITAGPSYILTPSQQISVVGSGFTPNSSVNIFTQIGTAQASTVQITSDSTGSFTSSIATPNGSGQHFPLYVGAMDNATTTVSNTVNLYVSLDGQGIINVSYQNFQGLTLDLRGNIVGTLAGASINWNDGNPTANLPLDSQGGFSVSHDYNMGGTYNVKIVAQTPDGSTASSTIKVTALTPQITVSPTAGNVSTQITLTGSGFTSNGQVTLYMYEGEIGMGNQVWQFTTTSNILGSINQGNIAPIYSPPTSFLTFVAMDVVTGTLSNNAKFNFAITTNVKVIAGSTTINVGAPDNIGAQVVDQNNNGMDNVPVDFYVNGAYIKTVNTLAGSGGFTSNFGYTFNSAGTYTITAKSGGVTSPGLTINAVNPSGGNPSIAVASITPNWSGANSGALITFSGTGFTYKSGGPGIDFYWSGTPWHNPWGVVNSNGTLNSGAIMVVPQKSTNYTISVQSVDDASGKSSNIVNITIPHL